VVPLFLCAVFSVYVVFSAFFFPPVFDVDALQGFLPNQISTKITKSVWFEERFKITTNIKMLTPGHY